MILAADHIVGDHRIEVVFDGLPGQRSDDQACLGVARLPTARRDGAFETFTVIAPVPAGSVVPWIAGHAQAVHPRFELPEEFHLRLPNAILWNRDMSPESQMSRHMSRSESRRLPS